MALYKSIAVFSIAALSLAGCSTTGLVDETAAPATTIETQSPEPSTEGVGESESEPLEVEATSTPEPTFSDVGAEQAESSELVSEVDILWEALMSADGEYAAAASYMAVLDEYGSVEPYATILEAELRHISALTRQLERLGVVVPDNPYIGEISAPANLTLAAEAWAEGEILNVAMYDELISQVSDSQVVKVLTNLRRSSLESHLPAFQAAAESGGVLENFQSNH